MNKEEIKGILPHREPMLLLDEVELKGDEAAGWLTIKGDEFFLFHQRDNHNPEPFGWDLATTKDFVDYRDCGVAVPRGGDDEQDQFTS